MDMPVESEVKSYYDKFSARFIGDIVNGNQRVNRQLILFSESICSDVKSILVIGCGSGESAFYIANKIAKNAKIDAIDISSENIAIANALFSHININYVVADVLNESISGKWDVILLPDVYEHIPLNSRQILLAKIKEFLSDDGKIILTVPSPSHQEYLRKTGVGLQIVDEDVSLADIIHMAGEVGAEVSYFAQVSVWHINDYIYAILEKNVVGMKTISARDRLPIKGWRKLSLMQNFLRLPVIRSLKFRYKSWKIKRALR